MTSPQFDLTLASSGNGWSGTFALAVTHVLEDILSDGAPVEARLTIETEFGAISTTTTTIVSVEAGKIHTQDGYTIDIDGTDRILKLEV